MTLSTTATLAAPSVQEADGDLLRPDMAPLGPTVRIPRSDTWIHAVTGDNEGEVVSHDFGSRVIRGNYDDTMLVTCAVIRKSGYIQYPNSDRELAVMPYTESLTPVRADELVDNVLILDTMGGRGLAVSVINQSETEGANVRFHLDESQTAAYPVRPGPAVDGIIPHDMLERHADTNCLLYFEAVKPDGDREIIVGRSKRRRITIRRSANDQPMPVPDPSLLAPSIDRLSSGTLDMVQFPGGALVRIGADTQIVAGDTVTIVFRPRNGLLAWNERVDIDESIVSKDIVRRMPTWILAYSRLQQGSLYYSLVGRDGVERFSPAWDVYVSGYVVRQFYQYICSMRSRDTDTDISECPPDTSPRLDVQSEVLRLTKGDTLVMSLRGETVDASMVIEHTIEAPPEPWIWFDVPVELIRRNAGGVILYRASRIQHDFVEHTPFRPLSILREQSDPSHAPAHG